MVNGDGSNQENLTQHLNTQEFSPFWAVGSLRCRGRLRSDGAIELNAEPTSPVETRQPNRVLLRGRKGFWVVGTRHVSAWCLRDVIQRSRVPHVHWLHASDCAWAAAVKRPHGD